MSEMMERVARAIAKRHCDDPDEVGASLDGIGYFHGPAWKVFEDDARAAMEAMREPTRHMLMASGFGRTQQDKWRAMIDEALR